MRRQNDHAPRKHLPAVVRVHDGMVDVSPRYSECGVVLPFAIGEHGRVCRTCQRMHDKKVGAR